MIIGHVRHDVPSSIARRTDRRAHSQLSYSPDLKHLCEVSRRLYRDTVPWLYRQVSLRVPEDDIGTVYARHWTASRSGHLSHARSIILWSPFCTRTNQRCMHHRIEASAETTLGNEAETEADP